MKYQIEADIPKGWEPVAFRAPEKGEYYIDVDGEVVQRIQMSCPVNYLIVRRSGLTGEALVGKLCWVWEGSIDDKLSRAIVINGFDAKAERYPYKGDRGLQDIWGSARQVKLSEIKDMIDMEKA